MDDEEAFWSAAGRISTDGYTRIERLVPATHWYALYYHDAGKDRGDAEIPVQPIAVWALVETDAGSGARQEVEAMLAGQEGRGAFASEALDLRGLMTAYQCRSERAMEKMRHLAQQSVLQDRARRARNGR